MTRSEDELILIPGNGGNCHAQRHPSVLLEHKKDRRLSTTACAMDRESNTSSVLSFSRLCSRVRHGGNRGAGTSDIRSEVIKARCSPSPPFFFWLRPR